MAKHTGDTTFERVLTELVAKVALEMLIEESYAATVAGLRYEIHSSSQGWNVQVTTLASWSILPRACRISLAAPPCFCVQVDGFSHKLPLLSRRVCEALASIAQAT